MLHRQATRAAGTEAQLAYADETWSASIGNETISAAHYGPATTSGDIVIFFENANVVHMGDLVFNRFHPFIDAAAGGDVGGWIRVLEAVMKRHPDGTFVFGHAKDAAVIGTRRDVERFRDYLTAVLQ